MTSDEYRWIGNFLTLDMVRKAVIHTRVSSFDFDDFDSEAGSSIREDAEAFVESLHRKLVERIAYQMANRKPTTTTKETDDED